MIQAMPYAVTQQGQLLVADLQTWNCASGTLCLDYTMRNWSAYTINIDVLDKSDPAGKLIVSQSDDMAWHSPIPHELPISPSFGGPLKGLCCPEETEINPRIIATGYFYCNVDLTDLHIKLWREDGKGFQVETVVRELVLTQERFYYRFVHDEPVPELPPGQPAPP